jgi:toxin YoeB
MRAASSTPWSVWKRGAGRLTTSSRPTEVLLVWDENAWQDHLSWQAQDRRVLKRTNTLLADVVRHGNEGIGKPEPLKHDFRVNGRDGSPTSIGSSTN